MAIKPTIYKTKITLADIDRDYYETLNLTIAQHPSETLERLMARVLAFCINAEEHLVFTKGLGDVKEPDIWSRTLDDRLSLWVEVGEPAFEKVKKATRVSPVVTVYTFNSKSDVWWTQTQEKFSRGWGGQSLLLLHMHGLSGILWQRIPTNLNGVDLSSKAFTDRPPLPQQQGSPQLQQEIGRLQQLKNRLARTQNQKKDLECTLRDRLELMVRNELEERISKVRVDG